MLWRRKQLGVSWIQARFSAHLLNQDQGLEDSYDATGILTIEDFAQALAKAVEVLDAQGADVSIVYEGTELSHPFIKAPPLSRRDLKLFVKNRAEEESMNHDAILYSFKKCLNHQQQNTILLHIAPKVFIEQIIEVCRKNQLLPVKFIPLSEIMRLETFRFSEKTGGIILMLAIFETLVEILVIRDDGEILLLRDLMHNVLQGESERLYDEINRTILYANQQFGADVAKIGLIEEVSSSIYQGLSEHFSIPIESTDINHGHSFWAREAALLSTTVEGNILPIQYQFKRSSIFIKRSLFALVGLFFLITLSFTVQTEINIRKQAETSMHIKQQNAQLLDEQKQLSIQVEKHKGLDLMVQEFRNNQRFPIGGWFLTELPSLMPHNVILKDTHITFDQNRWHFTIEGQFLDHAAQAPEQLTQFENSLTHLSLNLKITEHWHQQWFETINTSQKTHDLVFTIKGEI